MSVVAQCNNRVMARPRMEPDHGTRARYVHRTIKCRCPACTAENTAYIARYRRDSIQPYQPRTWAQQLPFR